MSTIKSSAENLTLNADGANNDIKFQSNGSEVASIDQAGTVTATTFTGAATDATKLPLAGGSMTNMLWVTGTNANNANNVGLGIWGGTTSQGIYARGNAASTNSFGLDSTGTTTFTQAGTERVKISSAGVLSASAGIELGSGLDATAANTLDDYEEGTFTPNVGGNATYTNQNGAYTKVGRLVTVKINFQINAINSSGRNIIYGLPFTSTSGEAHVGTVGYYSGLAVSPTWIGCYGDAANTQITFIWNTGNSATIGANGQNLFQNSARVDLSLTYQTT